MNSRPGGFHGDFDRNRAASVSRPGNDYATPQVVDVRLKWNNFGRHYQQVGIAEVIQSVTSDSQAAKAGLQSNDVIVEAGSRPIHSARDLLRVVAETPIGSKLSLTIERNEKRQQLIAEIGKMPALPQGAAETAPMGFSPPKFTTA